MRLRTKARKITLAYSTSLQIQIFKENNRKVTYVLVTDWFRHAPHVEEISHVTVEQTHKPQHQVRHSGGGNLVAWDKRASNKRYRHFRGLQDLMIYSLTHRTTSVEESTTEVSYEFLKLRNNSGRRWWEAVTTEVDTAPVHKLDLCLNLLYLLFAVC